MSDLTLGLRIRVNADGSAQVLGGVENSINRIGTAANQSSAALNSQAASSSAASQRMAAGMASAASSGQIAARVMQSSTGSISAGMSSAASSTQIAAAAMAESLRAASNTSRASMQSMTESMVANLASINSTLAAMDARLSASGALTTGVMARSAGATSGATAAFASMRGVVATLGLGILAKEMLGTIEQVQNLETRLRSLTSSAQDYAETERYLSTVAAAHHKNNLDLQSSFAQLLTIEQTGIITREQTKRILEGLSNAQSRTGASADALKNSMTGMTQALSMGTLAWEEIKQVTEPLPGLMMKIAEAAGFSGKTAIGDFKALVTTGQYTSEMFGQILPEALSKYEGAAAQSASNLTAQYADIKNAWTELAKALENPVSDTLTPILNATRDSLSAITEAIKYLKSLDAVGDQGMRAPGYVKPEVSATFSGLLSQPFTTAPKATPLAEAQKDAILVGQDYLRYLSTVEETDKRIAEEKKKAASEAKQQAEQSARDAENFVKKSDEMIAALLNEAEIRKVATKDQARETELRRVESTVVAGQRDYVRGLINAKYDEIEAAKLRDAASNASKAAMEAEEDRYKRLTLSAHEYYIEKLRSQGVGEPDIAARSALHDKNDTIERKDNSIDAMRTSLASYNKTLAETATKTVELGATNTAVFDGALGGLNAVSGAFDNMLKSLQANTAALEALHAKQVENDAFEKSAITDEARRRNNGQYLIDLKTIADNKRLYALESQKLDNENLKDSLTGIRQMASATGAMFAENTNARRAFNMVALAASISERAADLAGLSVKAASAMLTQGQGDPYTAFARIAAMAAIVGSILSAAGAGTFAFGGSSTGPKPELAPDTGTVLGDATAKSNSVGNVYELLKTIHAEEYAELKGINSGVAALSSGITNVVTRLFQAGGIKDPSVDLSGGLTGIGSMLSSAYLSKYIPVIGGVLGGIADFVLGGLFGKTTRSIVGGGILTGSTSISDIMAGGNLAALQYATIETKKKSWFSSSTSYSEQTSPIDPNIQKALDSLFKSMGNTMLGLADSLGGDLADRVRNYIIPSMRIELRGLSGEDAAKKLNGVISTALDTMASSVFGDIVGQYQQLGEGMLETAVRIVSEVAVVKDALAKSGLSLATNALAISDAIAQAAGGLEKFQTQFSTYFDKFYSDAEKQTDLQLRLSTVLDGSLAQTRDGYRKQIEALDLSNAKDLERYSLLIKMAGAADQYYAALENAAKAAEEAMKKLEDNVTTARNKLSAAYDRESSALTATINKFDGFTKSLQKFRDALSVGDLSTGSPLDKYAATRSQFDAVMTAINAGPGTTDASRAAYDQAQADFQAKSSAFLSASRDVNASGSAYKTDYQRVLAAIDKGIGSATAAKSTAEQQLDVLKESVIGLADINTSVLSVKEAIVLLNKNIDVQNATRDAITKKTGLDAAQFAYDAKLSPLQQARDADANALTTAQGQLAALNKLGAAPTTWQAGQSGNPIWEQVLAAFNANHAAQFNGQVMNRPWTQDSDAMAAYQGLVGNYNRALSSAIATATSAITTATEKSTASSSALNLYTSSSQEKTTLTAAQTAYNTAQQLVATLTAALTTTAPVTGGGSFVDQPVPAGGTYDAKTGVQGTLGTGAGLPH